MLTRRLIGAAVALAVVGLSTAAFAQEERERVPQFGGPSSVGGKLNDDAGDGLTEPVYRSDGLRNVMPDWFAFKDMLAADYGLSLSIDYQALRQAVSSSPGNDQAAGGIFRAYGSWTLLGRDSGNTGTLVFKVEMRSSARRCCQ